MFLGRLLPSIPLFLPISLSYLYPDAETILLVSSGCQWRSAHEWRSAFLCHERICTDSSFQENLSTGF